VTATKVIFALIVVALACVSVLHHTSFPPSNGGSYTLPETSPPSPASSSTGRIGETTTVTGDKPWICGSSKEAFDEATKWAELNDNSEMARSLAKTRSTLLMPGSRVKILESSFFLRKVRVLDTDKLSALLPPDKECWVAFEAVTR